MIERIQTEGPLQGFIVAENQEADEIQETIGITIPSPPLKIDLRHPHNTSHVLKSPAILETLTLPPDTSHPRWQLVAGKLVPQLGAFFIWSPEKDEGTRKVLAYHENAHAYHLQSSQEFSQYLEGIMDHNRVPTDEELKLFHQFRFVTEGLAEWIAFETYLLRKGFDQSMHMPHAAHHYSTNAGEGHIPRNLSQYYVDGHYFVGDSIEKLRDEGITTPEAIKLIVENPPNMDELTDFQRYLIRIT